MDKETLSNYGWIVICVMVLAVMIALATPFGSFVSDAVKSTTQGLFDVNQGALDAAGIEIMQQEFEGMLNGGSGGTETPITPSEPSEPPVTNPEFNDGKIEYNVNDPDLNHRNKIPEGGQFTHYVDGYYDAHNGWKYSSIQTFNEGDYFPEIMSPGDIYTYGDYEYCYQYASDGAFPKDKDKDDAQGDEWYLTATGWGVVYRGTSTTPSAVLESINNVPITDMSSTFMYFNIVVAPIIPRTVENMVSTFSECYNLETAPEIPYGVENLFAVFQNCSNLKQVHSIPSSVTNMCMAFYNCSSLTQEIEIPCYISDDDINGWYNFQATIKLSHSTNCGH